MAGPQNTVSFADETFLLGHGDRRASPSRDPVLRRLIAEFPDIHLTGAATPFTTLARAIVGQQISVEGGAKRSGSAWFERCAAAACRSDSIALRVGRTQRQDAMRAVGLSERKGDYVRDLARHFASGKLDPAAWPRQDDEAADRGA